MTLQLVTRTDEAKEDVIQRLEWALAEAREGNIVAIGLAWTTSDGGVNAGFSRVENAGALMGACALLQYRICKDD